MVPTYDTQVPVVSCSRYRIAQIEGTMWHPRHWSGITLASSYIVPTVTAMYVPTYLEQLFDHNLTVLTLRLQCSYKVYVYPDRANSIQLFLVICVVGTYLTYQCHKSQSQGACRSSHPISSSCTYYDMQNAMYHIPCGLPTIPCCACSLLLPSPSLMNKKVRCIRFCPAAVEKVFNATDKDGIMSTLIFEAILYWYQLESFHILGMNIYLEQNLFSLDSSYNTCTLYTRQQPIIAIPENTSTFISHLSLAKL